MPAGYLIDGGRRLRRGFLLAMLDAKSLEEAVNMLKVTRYGFLADVPEELFKGEKVSEFEKRLDRFLIARGLHAFNRRPAEHRRRRRVLLGQVQRDHQPPHHRPVQDGRRA